MTNVRTRSLAFWTVAALISVVALALSVWSGGAGDGDYIVARLLLPYACLLIALLPGGALVVVAAVLQWPAYALLLRRAVGKHHGWQIAVGIFTIHVAIAGLWFTRIWQP